MLASKKDRLFFYGTAKAQMILVSSLLLWGAASPVQAAICPNAVVTLLTTGGRTLTLVLKDTTEVELEFLGFSPAQIADPAVWTHLQTQVEEVERFLNELGADYPDGHCPICVAHIRPGGTLTLLKGKQLLWHGGNQITIRIPRVPFFGQFTADSDVLRVKWNRGNHHSSKSLVSRRWEYLNPVGPFRLGMRRTLHRAMGALQEKIGTLLSKSREEGDNTSLRQSILQLIAAQVNEPGSTLSDAAQKGFQRLQEAENEGDQAEHQRLLEILGHELADNSVVTKIESELDTALRADPPNQGDASTSTAISLGVSVSNAHDIRVRLAVVNGELVSEVGSPRQPLKTFSFGLLVAVATSDRVEVDLGAERAASSLAIDRALRKWNTP